MEEPKSFGRDFFKIGTPQCGVAIGLAGIALACLLLFLGFWKTLLIAIFFAGGFAIGAFDHKTDRIKKMLNRLFPPKGE